VATAAIDTASRPANGYREPAPALKAIVDAARPPQIAISPRRDLIALQQVPPLPSIALVAQPELKLAGMRLNPRSHSPSRASFASDLWLMEVATGKTLRIDGLPSPLSLASVAWSPDQRYLALNRIDPYTGSNSLWLVDVNARSARRLLEQPLNTVNGGIRWMPDSRRLLVNLRADQGSAPQPDIVPAGPSVREARGDGMVRHMRTPADVLRSRSDERMFEHYLRVQPALVGVDGAVRHIGKPDLYASLSPSPDGRHLLSQRIERPFSYMVPMKFFPRRIEVLSLDGNVLHAIAKLPLSEGLPSGSDAATLGVRSIGWRSDAPATLVWAEAQDGGDPSRHVEFRDHVFMQAAPFDRPPVVLATLRNRYAGIQWGRGDVALLGEVWRKTRNARSWKIAPDAPQTAPELVFEGSSEDRYNDPGKPVTVRDANGFSRLMLSRDGKHIYLIGDGASPEGDRPFLDRWNIEDLSRQRLFRSEAPTYASVVAVLDDEAAKILISRESPSEPANIHRLDLAGKAAPVALTAFKHPTPQLKDVQKRQIRYKRKDGVELAANLYLPPGFLPGRDKPLPLLMWAYPTEFKSPAAASQVTDSPYRFNAISYWGPHPFLARGYAVLDDPSMPIVGEGHKEPNDTYLPQLIASAEAAVDEVVRRGVADRDRIAIGGHSYGAFMVANLLAHTRMFKVGIARSGAYNRTLTPFGFQAEERNYWATPQTYRAMSPFDYADRIKDALLLMHGEEDDNAGTFPIQSERMFAAVKGLGGTARLVMLPKESHGYRARESILHMLAETDAWLEEFVRNAKPEPNADQSPATPVGTPDALWRKTTSALFSRRPFRRWKNAAPPTADAARHRPRRAQATSAHAPLQLRDQFRHFRRRELRETFRQQAAARGFLHRQQFHQLDGVGVLRRDEIGDGAAQVVRGQAVADDIATAFRRDGIFARHVQRQQRDGFQIGIGIPVQRIQCFDQRGIGIGRQRRAAALEDRAHYVHAVGPVVGIEERDLAIEATRALDVDIELVRTIGHQDRQHVAAVVGVGHEVLDPRDDPRRRAAVGLAAALAAAEAAVALVDDQRDGTHRADDLEHAFEVGFGRPHPLRAEILQHHARQPGFLQERLDDEGLADAHRTDREQSHGREPAVAGLDGRRDLHQLLLDLVVTADRIEAVARIEEFDQIAAGALDDLALARADDAQHRVDRVVLLLGGRGRAAQDQERDLFAGLARGHARVHLGALLRIGRIAQQLQRKRLAFFVR
jgi:dipeptidyl aminopeptidase/acylaminoacyl peptidase